MPVARCLQSPQAGFTLVEVLLAVAVLALVSVLISMSFTSTFHMLDAFRDEGDREHVARSCLSLIAQDLVTARRQTTSPFTGRNGDISGQPSDILAFSSAGHRRSQPNALETELTRVLYVRDEARLVRYEIVNPYIFTVDAVEQVELATGVAGFNVRYYDRSAKAWQDAWGGEGRTTLPGAAMIELTSLNARKAPRTYTAYVSFPWQGG